MRGMKYGSAIDSTPSNIGIRRSLNGIPPSSADKPGVMSKGFATSFRIGAAAAGFACRMFVPANGFNPPVDDPLDVDPPLRDPPPSRDPAGTDALDTPLLPADSVPCALVGTCPPDCAPRPAACVPRLSSDRSKREPSTVPAS